MSDYKVADIGLAGFGRKEIQLAEAEMPALMTLRTQVRQEQAAEGCAHHGLHPHDHPDRRADGNLMELGAEVALVLVQHFLHAGSRCRRDGRSGYPDLRLER
jgi:S-adenosylhomocysteine hydrolase